MSWALYNKTVWIFKHNTIDSLIKKDKLLCFDLDNTIINTKSKCKFPKNADDWEFINDSKEKIINDSKDNIIVIFSNQLKMTTENKINEIKTKIQNIIKELNISIFVFISTNNDNYRKPFIGMFELLLNEIYFINIKQFKEIKYIGDAAGRKDDFSCSDRKFAYNISLYYNKEVLFYTPEEYFLNEDPQNFNWNDINFEEYKNNKPINLIIPEQQEIILFVGFPGVGKTTFYNNYLKKFKYFHINQDELNTLTKCINLTKTELNLGKSVVIDNTNPSIETRQKYIKIAKNNKVSIRCIYFDIDEKLAKHLNKYRMLEYNKQLVPDISYNVYKKKFTMPSIEEGFDEVIIYNFILNENNINKQFFYMKF